jgi:diguanylate cyclase
MNQNSDKRTKRARLAPADFIAELRSGLGAQGNIGLGILSVQLNRSDRVQALAQDESSMAVMRQALERIEPLLKHSDYYCVVAHDEIWILLGQLLSESVARLAAESISASLRSVFTTQRSSTQIRTVRMNPVVGVVVVPPGQADVVEVFHLMDETAIRARRSDSRVAMARATEEGAFGKRLQLEGELRQALFANELEVFYQPQVELNSGKCISAEALIRWTRSNGQPVNAGLIASICEECGLMDQLTRYVLNNSLRFQGSLRARGIDLKISINLSAASLTDHDFPELVVQSSQTWGVSPSCLVFEVTEGSLVENETAAIDFMNRLRELGCELAIDDFGTGYSALAYLKKYPFSELKIDRAFVMGLGQDDSSAKLCRVLVDLSKTFGLRCVAEGVETEIARDILHKLGADIAQGYLYARALNASDFLSWVEKHNTKASQAQLRSAAKLGRFPVQLGF